MRVPAEPEALDALHAGLARFWVALARRAVAVPEEQRDRFALAVIEIGGNVIRHAYPPGGAGALELHLLARPARLEAHYLDRGRRYEPPPPAPIVPYDEAAIEALPEGGFGLLLTREVLDRFDYERTPDGRNHWTLVSNLHA